ncbi:hypothetical protein A3A66_04030 [Microgenomates group bacterium RIFCSPLOWO2_01_FULL_46_13]|nr:MAG: hypothetical protein A2783_05530 [Microgenomates group bacterium RIFCSPHIGHO2_01_FULL_45_11]OGV94955.1 MAG: hypothetical protein A3A66_04030 [Microgenomates group bacterium RIFCSPLOWO2_01_FULL_46_13]
MGLSVGIVGLPNVGKSTLFNALASRRLAETAARPFTTIEPHEAVVAVPDEKLTQLVTLVKPEEITPATVTFIDIAGLVKGAHKGEGLGNQFLAKIREVEAVVQVVRAFVNPQVSQEQRVGEPGSSEQVKEDIQIVNEELKLGGIEKPTIYVLNVGEKDLTSSTSSAGRASKAGIEKIAGDLPVIQIGAKLEEELIDLEPEERKQYLEELGVGKSGLDQLIKVAYDTLDLLTFYTIKGGKETRATALPKGSSVIEAAGRVHTDFAQKFIRAEVINIDELLGLGGWRQAKEKGKIRTEGRDYVVQEGDVVEFMVGK